MIDKIDVKLLMATLIGAVLLTNFGSAAIWGQQSGDVASPPSAQARQQAMQEAPSPAGKQEKTKPTTAEQTQFSSSVPEVSKPLVYPDTHSYITVPEDTLIRVRTGEPLSSRYSKDGQAVLFALSEDVIVNNMLVIPRGAAVHGEVIGARKAGTLTGSPALTLKLVSLELGGQSYPLYTYQFQVQGTSKTKPTETKVKGGAVIGAIAGGVFSGSAKGETTAVGKLAGMGTGAVLGAGVGALTSAATPGPSVTLPVESQMDFYLASPISVRPVSASEAARLAQGLHPGGPVLYVRGDVP